MTGRSAETGEIRTVEPGDRVVDGIYRALPDPVDDTLLSLLMNLTAEVWTLRDRLRLVESALEGYGVPVTELVDAARTTDAYRTSMVADREQFIARTFAALVPAVADTST